MNQDQPVSSDVPLPGSLPNSSSESQYEALNEISAEASASRERILRLVDYEPCRSPVQLRAMWAAYGIHTVTNIPPPRRYRRVPKNAFVG